MAYGNLERGTSLISLEHLVRLPAILGVRITFLGAKARRELVRYLRLRPDARPSDPLWATETGSRLTYAGLRQVVRRRALRAGLDHEPSLHSFRRSFALLSLHRQSRTLATSRTGLTITTGAERRGIRSHWRN